MTKTEKELKKEFSAYVKTAIKNTQKQYLIKKGKILDNEIAMDDEGIDEILQKQIEDLFDKMDLNVDMVLSDEINVNSFLDQINDPVLYVSLCSLKEAYTITGSGSGHFIVLTGVTRDGYITIADCASRERTGKVYSVETIKSYGRDLSEGAFWIVGKK